MVVLVENSNLGAMPCRKGKGGYLWSYINLKRPHIRTIDNTQSIVQKGCIQCTMEGSNHLL
jgi:hypothetical protein